MNLLIKTLAYTICLLLLYWSVLRVSDIKPRFAESNFIANQVRLQSAKQSAEGYHIVVVGSSLSARLDTSVTQNDKASLNLSLDGSSALFGAKYALAVDEQIETVVIEMNTIYRETAKNDKALADDLESGTNRLATWFPLVRAQARPVTIMYSKLKEYKDSRTKSLLNVENYAGISTHVVKAGSVDSISNVEHIEHILESYRERKTRVVLFFIPDGDRNNDKEKLLANYLSSKYGCEILDLENIFKEGELNYTDGLHLSVPSARSVTELIEGILSRK